MEASRIDQVRRELRTATEWKRDARLPCEVARELLGHLEPTPSLTADEILMLSRCASYVLDHTIGREMPPDVKRMLWRVVDIGKRQTDVSAAEAKMLAEPGKGVVG
jgi:hypothetical protein